MAKQQKEEIENENSSTLEIKELSDVSVPQEGGNSGKRKSVKLNDKDMITSTSRSKRTSSKNTDQVINLPTGYIKMRDAT